MRYKFGGRCIDWFLMSAIVGAAVVQMVVRKEAFTRPHSPVCVTFKPPLSLLKKLVMDAPQKLPIEPIIGPLKPLPVAWNAGKLVRAVVQSARCDPSWDNADQALAEAYRASANLWGAEIQERTPRPAKACAVGLSPGRPLLKQTKRELAASCMTARSMEWALSRLVEARHWALLDRLKQITLALVSLWKNVVSGQGEEEHFGGSWDASLGRIGRMGSHRS